MKGNNELFSPTKWQLCNQIHIFLYWKRQLFKCEQKNDFDLISILLSCLDGLVEVPSSISD